MQSVSNRAPGKIFDLSAGLIQAAGLIKKEAGLRWVLLIGASLAGLTLIGYHTGSFDQAIHIPFLKAWADPTLYPADPFVRLRSEQYSFFWFFFIPFVRLGWLEPALFALHLFTLLLTFWAVWRLSTTLFDDPLTSLIGVVVLAFPHLDLLGFPFIEFSLLNRTFVLPFVLLAIDLFLRGKRLPAFALLGLMYNLHVLSVNYALILLLPVELGDLFSPRSRPGLGRRVRMLASRTAAFTLAALPVLLWRLNNRPFPDLQFNREWMHAVGDGILHHIFYPFSGEPYALATNLSGLAMILLLFIARRRAPSPRYDKYICRMVTAGLAVIFFQAIAARWAPLTLLMQLQLARVSGLISLLCILSIAHALAQALRSRRLEGPAALLALAALAFSVLAFVLLPVWAWLHARKPVRYPAVVLLSLVYLPALIFGGLLTGFWDPGIRIYPAPSPWLEVQAWARLNTPKEAVFITPLERWDVYTPDWRVYSERATLATYTELLEIALAPSYLDTWLGRASALVPGELEWPGSNYITNRRYLEESFARLSDSDVMEAACTFQAGYVVVEKPQAYPFPLAYENGGFRVYELHCPDPTVK